MIRNFGSVGGITMQPSGLDIGLGGGSNIKSIQRGVTTIPADTISVSVNITPVDLTKSFIKITYKTTGSGNHDMILPTAYFINSGSIAIERANANTTTVTVSWEVIDFSGNVKVQSGSVVLANGTLSVTSTITAVDITKSLLFFSLKSNDTTTNYSYIATIGTITNSTQLTFDRVSNSSNLTINYFVLEFK